MKPGDTVALGAYTFRLDSVEDVKGPNYVAARATISVTRDGKPATVLHPEKRFYTVQAMPMTEAAIDPGFTRDLYVSLGDSVGPTGWIVRGHHKPFADWIWGGPPQPLWRVGVGGCPGGAAGRPPRGERPPLPARGEERARGRGHGRR